MNLLTIGILSGLLALLIIALILFLYHKGYSYAFVRSFATQHKPFSKEFKEEFNQNRLKGLLRANNLEDYKKEVLKTGEKLLESKPAKEVDALKTKFVTTMKTTRQKVEEQLQKEKERQERERARSLPKTIVSEADFVRRVKTI